MLENTFDPAPSLPSSRPNVVAWSSLLWACAAKGDSEAAVQGYGLPAVAFGCTLIMK